ncbi:hypothetical protein [Gordonia jacobaea]|uniref:hypothetical protein n=1 Tax=Gordonia jacobaea TaxID=122202 RepID=UPI003D711040
MTDPNNPNNPQQPYPNQGGTPSGQPYYPPQQGQPYPGYPATEPPKQKRKKWPWILLAIFVVIIAIIASCSVLVGGAVKSVDDESKRVVDVTYEITGDGPTASATYTTGNLNIAQDTDVPVPWTKQVQISGLGKSVTLSASNSIDGSGTITCAIKQGDKVISTNTSSGPGATASCSGTAD